MWPSISDLIGDRPGLPNRWYSWAHCRDCGARLGWSETDCPACGETQRAVESDRDPELAVALSVVVPGAGHFYVGDERRGAFQFLAVALVLVVVVLGAVEQGGGFALGAAFTDGPSVGPLPAWSFFAFQWLSSALTAAHHANGRAEEANYGIGPGEDAEDCPDCDAPNPEGASFCRNCGRDLPDPDATETVHRFRIREGVCFCESCNSQVSPSDRACPACGFELKAEEPVPA